MRRRRIEQKGFRPGVDRSPNLPIGLAARRGPPSRRYMMEYEFLDPDRARGVRKAIAVDQLAPDQDDAWVGYWLELFAASIPGEVGVVPPQPRKKRARSGQPSNAEDG
jgi:hypothetical protein